MFRKTSVSLSPGCGEGCGGCGGKLEGRLYGGGGGARGERREDHGGRLSLILSRLFQILLILGLFTLGRISIFQIEIET